MSDLKKLFKLVWKRFSVWIILLTILTLMLNGLSAREQLDRYQVMVERTVDGMANDLGEDIPKRDGKFDKKSVSYTHLTLPTILLV